MYASCKPTIISVINLLSTDPSFDGHVNSNTLHKRSLLPFLGDALNGLQVLPLQKMSIVLRKVWTNSSKLNQHNKKPWVHIVSILNITRYAAQVNRHSINVLMDKVDETSHDVNNLYNLTTSLATSLSYHQLIPYIRSVWANLPGSLSYIRTVSTHIMDCIDAAMTGTLSPCIFQ